jgi:Family of unknown function (DUF5317)
VILIALAVVSVLSVPLTGGRLQNLARVEVRSAWLPLTALALQVWITTLAPGGNPRVYTLIHIATYGLIALFLWSNRHLPGARLIAVGVILNAVVITINGGVMPAAAAAQRLAGLSLGPGFHNSAQLAHPVLPWLGDVIPVPGPLPNVLSVGDLIVFAGLTVLLQRTSRLAGARDGAPPAVTQRLPGLRS